MRYASGVQYEPSWAGPSTLYKPEHESSVVGPGVLHEAGMVGPSAFYKPGYKSSTPGMSLAWSVPACCKRPACSGLAHFTSSGMNPAGPVLYKAGMFGSSALYEPGYESRMVGLYVYKLNGLRAFLSLLQLIEYKDKYKYLSQSHPTSASSSHSIKSKQ